MKRNLILGLAFLFFAISASQLIRAECIQPARSPIPVAGAFCGIAIDQSGERLAGQDLDLIDSTKQVIATAHSDSKGRFEFPNVARGVYHVQLWGFTPTSNTIQIANTSEHCNRRFRVDFVVYSDCGSHIRFEYGTLRVILPVDLVKDVIVDRVSMGVAEVERQSMLYDLVRGPHRIEIVVPGYEPVQFNVRLRANHTTTYRVGLVHLPK